jgi:multimeric flavodoxin WrbA
MKLLVIIGAPRRTGYTRELVELFCAGARTAGAEAEVRDLCQLDVRPCTGCYSCWSAESPGRCVQDDDMASLIAAYLEARHLVLATPLYFYSFSALMKAFVERLFPLVKPRIERSPRLGLLRNVRRHADRGPEGAVLIAAGAHRGLRNMEGLSATFELVCEGLGIDPRGRLLRTESFFLDFVASKPITHRKIRGAFESAGRELVLSGRVSAATEADAALPIVVDDDTYIERSDVYWQIADEIQTHGADRLQLRERAAIDLRILVPELAACLDPAAAGDLSAVILLDIDGDADRSWHLAIEDGRCRPRRGAHADPDLTLSMPESTLLDLIFGRIDPRVAVREGAIVARGSPELLARMGRLFPPPSR